MALELQPAIEKQTAAGSGGKNLRLFEKRKVTDSDRIFLTEQLQLLLDTGVSLHAALTALAGQAQSGALKNLLELLREDVAAGRPFSEALASHPEAFPESYVNLVSAAEQGGFLPQVLSQLQEMEEKREELRNTVKGALTYPAFLAFFSLAVVVFILVAVFPKFGKMFVSIQDQLPPSTKALMWMSDLLRYNWIVVLGIFSISVLALQKALRLPATRARIDQAKVTMPGIKELFLPVYLIQILRTLGTSIANGVALVDALHGCRGIVANQMVREFLINTEARVREGMTFSTAFADASFLPSLTRRMIATGDETGNLGPVMIRISAYYERELARRLDKFSKIAEPAMLLVMGAVVGVLVSSLILPIFKLTRAVG